MLKIKMNGLKIKQILLLYSLGILSVIWIFVLLLYMPQAARNEELRSQLKLQQQQVLTVENFALSHPEADKYLLELDQKRALVDKMLPNTPDLSEFVLLVERAAKEAGVQVSQIKPASPINKEGYREIAVEILIKGNFFQTTNFMKRLEDGPRFNNIQGLVMSSRQGIIESKFNLTIYSFGIAPVPSPVAQTQGQTNKK